ncbi:MAG: hypothetical protein CVU38_03665 [Chloroflexi bacterium HGW-Chloroflexi-1]|nr:MAG: hypothetical protein CVU38_03665 [Chloroflexi bacterium HGW-Chloroflexi-1]
MKQIHIKLSETLHRDLRIQAAIKGQSLQDYVVQALQNQVASDQSTNGLVLTHPKDIGDDSGAK